jgi:hypothetical protein
VLSALAAVPCSAPHTLMEESEDWGNDLCHIPPNSCNAAGRAHTCLQHKLALLTSTQCGGSYTIIVA